MASNSKEYNTLLRNTTGLRLAVAPNIIPLSGALLEVGLISPENESELRNRYLPEADRAARLVELVRTKVQLDPENFSIFLEVLQNRDQRLYADILRKLDPSSLFSSAGSSSESVQPPSRDLKKPTTAALKARPGNKVPTTHAQVPAKKKCSEGSGAQAIQTVQGKDKQSQGYYRSKLNHLSQIGKIKDISYDETSIGEKFKATARMKHIASGRAITGSSPAVCDSKRAAYEEAAKNSVFQIENLERRVGPETANKADDASMSKSWKSKLHEYIAKTCEGVVPKPHYETKSHPLGGFTSTVTCEDISMKAKGVGPSKAFAEQNAACNALKKLNQI